MTIAKDSAAFFHYTLTDNDGNVIDKSPEGQPLAYLHGHNNIVPGLEKQLEGKSAGDEFTAVVEPEEGYGEHHPEGVQEIPREHFQGIEKIEVGMQFETESEGGVMPVMVTAVADDVITIDANHPLAGQQLTFEVNVDSVREATEEELSHGHIHGEGGVSH